MQNNMSLLHWAVKRNFVGIAQYLIQKGIYKNGQDVLGRTPLHLASRSGYLDMVKVRRNFWIIFFLDIAGQWSEYEDNK